MSSFADFTNIIVIYNFIDNIKNTDCQEKKSINGVRLSFLRNVANETGCCPYPWSKELFSAEVLRCCSVAVGKGKDVRGWRQEKGKRSKAK
jgi:hypothetical protein